MILLACLGSFALAFIVLWWAFKDAEWRIEREDYEIKNVYTHGFKGLK